MRPANAAPAVVSLRAVGWRAVAALVAAAATAACGSSTTTSTAPSTIERCAVTLQAGSTAVPAGGGAGTIAVVTARECGWSAESEAGWLTITGSSNGQGDGSIQYRAAANPDPVSRRGAIAANDQRAEITQAAAACVITLEESGAEFPPSGGGGEVEVAASSSLCEWTAAANVPWITLTGAATGSGSGDVDFSVAPTTGPPRTGTITVANQTFTVLQGQGCTYAIAPTSAALPAAGGDGTIAVDTAAGCPWTAASNAPWIAIADGTSGTGPGSVAFVVASTSGPSRTGTLAIAGRTFTVTQSPGCVYEVDPLNHAAPASGGTLPVTVRTTPGCDWTASSAVPWITITGPASGAGTGTVTLVVAASTGSARSGAVSIAGRTVTVTQAEGCTFTIEPESASVPPAGGTGRVEVSAAAGCAWNAESRADWITIASGASGSGNGTVEYSVAATPGPARTGTMAIAGHTFTVVQGEGCEATLSPESATVPAAGAPVRFDVRIGDACEWTAAASVPWIAIESRVSGTGSGTVRLKVGANAGAERTGTVTAAGETFTVVQASGCSVAIGASELSVPAAGGAHIVDVRAAPGCGWTAEAAQPWTTIESGTGEGNGTLAFTVAANPGPARMGTIAIGSEVLTIRQEGGCTFAIAPERQSVGADGGRVSVTVSGAEGCAWTAASEVPWVTVASGASGSGDGTVTLDVAASTGPARTGAVTIAGQAFIVEQGSGCTYSVAPPARSEGRSGGNGSFNVTSSDPACTWTAASQVPWIVVTRGASGDGGGRVDYRVLPNPGRPRSGTIRVETAVFTVNQSGT